MSTTIPQLSHILQELLLKDADRIGHTSGFIQRQRKFSGSSFARSLIFGWQSNPQASLEELCQSSKACNVSISPQGLQERLNSPEAATFMQQLLEQAVTYVVTNEIERGTILSRFNGVYIQDSTVINLPQPLRQQWVGCGNQNSQKAALKVQTLLNYQQGHLSLGLFEAKRHDCPLQRSDLPVGSLRLADTAYFKVETLKHLSQQGVWWVSRLPARVGLWQDDHIQHCADFLAQQTADVVDIPVEVSAQQLACRLIAVRVPQKVSQQRRTRTKSEAKRRLQTPKAKTLALCDWTIVVTNLSSEQVSVQEILILLRLRWQIELLFKLWKQTLSVDEWRSQNPWQILTEVYTKLLIALIQHWLFVVGGWQHAQFSLVKATLLLRKHAFYLLIALPHPHALGAALSHILAQLPRCLIQKRKARPATFQLLDRALS